MFGSDYLFLFDQFYSLSRTRAETDFLKKHLKLSRNTKILDMACGQGRHALELAKQGFAVTGVDSSSVLIRAAKDRAKKAGLKINFIEGDMRSIRLPQSFNACFIFGNAFGYFNDKENIKVIKTAWENLLPKGKLILDTPNLKGAFLYPRNKREDAVLGGRIISENIGFNPRTCVLSLRWTFVRGGQKAVHYGRIRLYSIPEISGILRDCGFRISKIYGSLQGERFGADSPRVLIIAEKLARKSF